MEYWIKEGWLTFGQLMELQIDPEQMDASQGLKVVWSGYQVGLEIVERGLLLSVTSFISQEQLSSVFLCHVLECCHYNDGSPYMIQAALTPSNELFLVAFISKASISLADFEAAMDQLLRINKKLQKL